MRRRPPRSTRTDTHFPYTTLFRSARLILGPLFGDDVPSVRAAASDAGVNVVSFTTDRTMAGGNVAVMGVLPSSQVNRVVERSEERRVGKECVSTCRSRWSPYH